MPKDFVLPDLGEGITEAQIVRILIKPGQTVAEDQYLVEVETDKAAVEIPSPFAGVATEVLVHEGQTINVGDVIVRFDIPGGKVSGPSKEKTDQTAAPPVAARPPQGADATATQPVSKGAPVAPAVAPAPPLEAPPVATPAPVPVSRKTPPPAAPVVRRLAREMGIDLTTVAGSGPGGRITQDDLKRNAVSAGSGSAPSQARSSPLPHGRGAVQSPPGPSRPGTVDTDKWGQIRREPLSQIRKTIASRMSRSATTIPHVTHCDEADISELDRMRRSLNEATGGEPKLTAMSFLIRAICIAIRKYPAFNAVFDEEGQQIIYKDYVNMGIAVDTQRGLIVPVIRGADQLSLRGIAMELRTIADRIRSNQFAIEDLRGGSFTVTNVGALGGVFTTPLINYPEVAILGLGRSRKVPVVRGDEITKALMLPISLSFDHRVTDGANAARFTREIIGYLEAPAKFLLE